MARAFSVRLGLPEVDNQPTIIIVAFLDVISSGRLSSIGFCDLNRCPLESNIMGCSNSRRNVDEVTLGAADDPRGTHFKREADRCSRMWRKVGLPCSPGDHLDFESNIIIDRGLYEEYNNFQGHFEYYVIRDNLHGAICTRRADGVRTNTGCLTELLIHNPSRRKQEWFIQIRRHPWNPGEKGMMTGTLGTSRHQWNVMTAMDAVAKHARAFGKYNPIRRNCRHFVEELRDSMVATGPSPDVPLATNYWDIGKHIQGTYDVMLILVPKDLLFQPDQGRLDDGER